MRVGPVGFKSSSSFGCFHRSRAVAAYLDNALFACRTMIRWICPTKLPPIFIQSALEINRAPINIMCCDLHVLGRQTCTTTRMDSSWFHMLACQSCFLSLEASCRTKQSPRLPTRIVSRLTAWRETSSQVG